MFPIQAKLSAKSRTLALVLVTSFSISAVHASIKQETFALKNESVRAYSWSDEDVEPKMVLIGLHGGIQHGGNFAALAQELVPKGIRFYAIDYRGHGNWLKQGGKRPKVDYNASTADLIEITERLRVLYPHAPVFCIGESLGASVALSAMAVKPKIFDGIIFASAGSGLALSTPWQSTLKSVGQGFRTAGRTINLMPFVTKISDDQRSNEEMFNDPLVRRENSVEDLLHTVKFIHKSHSLAKKIGNETPILVIQGSDDQIIQPKSSQALYNQLLAKDKSFVMFPKVGHLLVTTKFLKPQVLTAVEDWLFKHAKQLQPKTAETNSAPANFTVPDTVSPAPMLLGQPMQVPVH